LLSWLRSARKRPIRRRRPIGSPPHSYEEYCAQATSHIAQVWLTDAGLMDLNKVDDKKTEIQLLAKKPLFKDIWEMVYHLVVHQNDGKSLSAVVVTTSYYGECPGDHVKTYVISKEVGELPSLKYLPDVKDQPSN
jgi:hypothetical protein